jgi:glyoxylase-like metal-dependent hydrolase (beta-lactamase superfamily II)
VLVIGFPADALDTNCYVLAPAPGDGCVVVDPGIGVMKQLDSIMAKYRLHPVAVLITHGHLDHVFSVAPVAGGGTAYVHPADRDLLADPTKGLPPDLRHVFGGLPYAEPGNVETLPDAGTITVAGLEFTVDLAPGHTPGSVLFGFASAGTPYADEGSQVCLAGDVLFAGSIGRCDLPGGSWEQMRASLRDKILPLADDTVVLPGHGPRTTIGRERVTNPYLLEIAHEEVADTIEGRH